MESIELLKQQIHELNEQVKHLVKTERRLYQTQTEVDRQVRRVHALNQFLLRSSEAGALVQIMGFAISMLQSLFALERTLVFMSRPGSSIWDEMLTLREVRFPSILREIGDSAVFCTDGICHEPALRSALEGLGVIFSPGISVTVIPLHGREGEMRGMVILQSLHVARISFHDRIPREKDLDFFRLFKTNLETAIENWTLHTQLEAEVMQRTERLREAQEQLVHAGKMAAVGTLAAGLAHELNNPIAIIIGYAQALSQANSPSELPSALAIIEKQGRRCADLVRALLDFSRKSPSTRSLVSVEELCKRIFELLASRARSNGVAFVVETGDFASLTRLNVSVVSVESVLVNLVVNALDATAAGGSVRLKTTLDSNVDSPGVFFQVSDTGAGIEAKILPRIFDPFFTTKPVGRGTGLGLSLARQFVEAHDGKIEVESIPGKGTTFLVWLPAYAENASVQPRKRVN